MIQSAAVRIHWPVHPRLRGEHIEEHSLTKDNAGSSPPARGTYKFLVYIHVTLRFIPACAGNMTSASDFVPLGAVHPRLRGEHIRQVLYCFISGGSSPPARGTFSLEVTQDAQRRFIPACAGNISSTSSRAILPSVHPRLRGEHNYMPIHSPPPCGSSPPARGTSVFFYVFLP